MSSRPDGDDNRRMRMCVAFASLWLGCCPAAPEVAPSGATDLAALSWLVGHWSSRDGDTVTEEHWGDARIGVMLGFNRTLVGGKMTHHELLVIGRRGEEVFYRAYPEGQPPASFALVELGEAHAVFADPEHDYPQRIRYRREGDTLVARIEGIDRGRPRSAEWRLSRVR